MIGVEFGLNQGDSCPVFDDLLRHFTKIPICSSHKIALVLHAYKNDDQSINPMFPLVTVSNTRSCPCPRSSAAFTFVFNFMRISASFAFVIYARWYLQPAPNLISLTANTIEIAPCAVNFRVVEPA